MLSNAIPRFVPMWRGFGSIRKTYGFTNPINSYRSLWELINGQGSWDINPHVWAIQFEFADCPNGFR